MYRDYVKHGSSALGREMEFLWFGQFGRPVLLFPTSSGRFYENEDFKLTASLARNRNVRRCHSAERAKA